MLSYNTSLSGHSIMIGVVLRLYEGDSVLRGFIFGDSSERRAKQVPVMNHIKASKMPL